MALHPQARAAVAASAAELPVYDPAFDIAASRAEARDVAAKESGELVEEVVDLDADGVRCRLYRPGGADGVVVHLHGGGFVFHDIDVHDTTARRVANRIGMAVLSVDYRRPPEHRFPAAPDDVDTVLGWLDREGAALGLDLPTYVHGDSAGGNLALVAALRNPGRFAAVVLIYPFLDPSAGFDSYRTAADGFDAREAAWYWDQYAAPEDHTHPDVAPLLSDRLGSLPPTLVITAEHDPLRDEGEAYAARLAEAGVPVSLQRYAGQMHAFFSLLMLPGSEQGFQQVVKAVRACIVRQSKAQPALPSR
jgi:acetyl esterase